MQTQAAQTIWTNCARGSLVNLGQFRRSRLLSGPSSRRLRVVMAQDEQKAAQDAAALADKDEETIFDKIVQKKIPCDAVYEDDLALAFKDINPTAPTHIVVIPKNRDGLTRLSKAEERHKELLGHLMWVAAKVARDQGLAEGFRTVINDGPLGCQSVYHLHIHVIGGKQLSWPPGC